MSSRTGDRPTARAVVLVAGAVVVYLLLDRGTLGFGYVPLLVGGSYLAAAVAGGRGGALWAPGCVVGGWGLANAALMEPSFDPVLRGAESAAHMTGIGLGVLALAALERTGVRTSTTSVALSVLLSGLIFLGQRAQGWELLNSPTGYAALLLVYAAAELVVVQVRRRR
ncbi:MAG: hypothetical protein JWN17_2681 [Frankiales bacterium]|nr:hypothetical protein [Frankiales bacterium]